MKRKRQDPKKGKSLKEILTFKVNKICPESSQFCRIPRHEKKYKREKLKGIEHLPNLGFFEGAPSSPAFLFSAIFFPFLVNLK